ncbi:MAG: hypothetical protein KTR33_10110, partial [Gammaproteobacteria bacterium]|nr:hypothetical protein [Gammaproteobacteria bacterium]
MALSTLSRQIMRGLLAALAMALAVPAAAQDVFGNTGSSTHSYNYVEFQYLVNIDTDLPLYLTALIDINESLSFNAEYLRVTESVTESGQTLDLEAQQYGIGLVYHEPFGNFESTDWVAGFLIGRITASGRLGNVRASIGENFQQVYGGLRKTLSEKLEAEAGVTLASA